LRAANLVARGIRIVPTLGPAVIVWGCHCRTNGSGTHAHAHATTHVCSAIDATSHRDAAAIDSSAIDSSANCGAASIHAASVRECVSRNTRDAKDGDYSNGNGNSK
jgi:hypothetical protein